MKYKTKLRLNNCLGSLAALSIGIGFLTIRYLPWVVVAFVGGHFISKYW